MFWKEVKRFGYNFMKLFSVLTTETLDLSKINTCILLLQQQEERVGVSWHGVRREYSIQIFETKYNCFGWLNAWFGGELGNRKQISGAIPHQLATSACRSGALLHNKKVGKLFEEEPIPTNNKEVGKEVRWDGIGILGMNVFDLFSNSHWDLIIITHRTHLCSPLASDFVRIMLIRLQTGLQAIDCYADAAAFAIWIRLVPIHNHMFSRYVYYVLQQPIESETLYVIFVKRCCNTQTSSRQLGTADQTHYVVVLYIPVADSCGLTHRPHTRSWDKCGFGGDVEC